MCERVSFAEMSSHELWRRAALALYRPVHLRGAPVTVVKRGLASERPEDSSTSNWGAGEPPIDEKTTERGVSPGDQRPGTASKKSDSHSEDQKSTDDFINSKREERMKFGQGSKPMSEGDADGERVRSQQEAVKEGAPHPADMAGG